MSSLFYSTSLRALWVFILSMLTMPLVGEDSERHVVELYIGYVGTPIDKTRLYFHEDCLPTYEVGLDNVKTISETAAFQLYSIDERGATYSFNHRPLGDGHVQLGIVVRDEIMEGEFTASRLDYSAFLIDNALDVVHNLNESPYCFQSLQGTYENRFELYVISRCLGDADGNGIVNADDIEILSRYIVGTMNPGIHATNADLNEDERITVSDLVMLINEL